MRRVICLRNDGLANETVCGALVEAGRFDPVNYGRLFPTTVVGSYPQPAWLIDRDKLKSRLPPRVRACELWRVDQCHLKEAQDDATLVAIHDQQLAGIDIIGDGEMRRESYSNRLVNEVEGIDLDNPGTAIDRTGAPNSVPRVVGPLRLLRPVVDEDVRFLRRNTTGLIKITLPGPFTMTQQSQNDYFAEDAMLAMVYADVLNQEIRDAFDAGADIVQLDEPYLQVRPEEARRYGVAAINRAFADIKGHKALHICFGYAHIHAGAAKPNGYSFLPELDESAADLISIEAAQPCLDLSVLSNLPSKDVMLGVIDLNDLAVETAATVAARITAALEHIPAERLVIAPDCGMKYLPRATAFGKLQAMTAGAALVRQELGA
jgi:5-methyltetrahydropteroyltriglutamate--homocysteine methyltransferase